ncbi:hypothetical protein M8J76_010098 [Diaphorina citri]|nr:hypothetical protein M8J76_010098 [Diaphorina citri]
MQMTSHTSHRAATSSTLQCCQIFSHTRGFGNSCYLGFCTLIQVESFKMSDTAAKHLAFLEEIGKLKHIKRTGWVLRNVNDPETISGHMYRMAVMTFLLDENNETKLNRTRCMELALLHDMAECIVGDLTPYCGVSKEEKHRREDEAMKTLKSLCHTQGDRMYTLFQEYESQETPEAKFVKELDIVDMLVQAFEYEKAQHIDLSEFFVPERYTFVFPLTKSMNEELVKQRNELIRNKTTQNGTIKNAS